MKVRNKYGEIVAVKYIGAKKDDKIIGAFPANSRPDII